MPHHDPEYVQLKSKKPSLECHTKTAKNSFIDRKALLPSFINYNPPTQISSCPFFSFLLWCPTVFTTDARDGVHKIITSPRLKTGIHTALAASTSVSEVVDIGDYKDIIAI